MKRQDTAHLPKLIQFSLAVRLVSVAVGPMPVLLVLSRNDPTVQALHLPNTS